MWLHALLEDAREVLLIRHTLIVALACGTLISASAMQDALSEIAARRQAQVTPMPSDGPIDVGSDNLRSVISSAPRIRIVR
jgi:hypothetical protein